MRYNGYNALYRQRTGLQQKQFTEWTANGDSPLVVYFGLFNTKKRDAFAARMTRAQNTLVIALFKMDPSTSRECSPGKGTQRVGQMESSWMLLWQSSRPGLATAVAMNQVRFERGSWMRIS